MPTLTEKDWESLSGSSEIKKHLRIITPDHYKAFGCYLIGMPVWLIFAVWGGWALDRAGLYPGRWVLGSLLLIALLLPLWPLLRVHRHLHRPVLEKIATIKGMDYASHDFELKAYEVSGPRLFGEEASERFRDLLLGKEGDKVFAICRAEIEADGAPVYSGLFYWLKRRGNSPAFVSAMPIEAAERLKPAGKAQRLPGLGDADYDAVFATFANQPKAASSLLGAELRDLLLERAAHGPVFFHLGQNNVFLAAGPPASFEASDDTPRGERLRAIFENVRSALDLARAVRAKLDRL